jgi:hypothetical protein
VNLAQLVAVMDRLEADGAVLLTAAELAAGGSLASEIAAGRMLVDYRERIDPATGELEQVTLARLNRRHPDVHALTDW